MHALTVYAVALSVFLTVYAVALTVFLTVVAVLTSTVNHLEQQLNTILPITIITTGFTSDIKYIDLKNPFKIKAQAKLFFILKHA